MTEAPTHAAEAIETMIEAAQRNIGVEVSNIFEMAQTIANDARTQGMKGDDLRQYIAGAFSYAQTRRPVREGNVISLRPPELTADTVLKIVSDQQRRDTHVSAPNVERLNQLRERMRGPQTAAPAASAAKPSSWSQLSTNEQVGVGVSLVAAVLAGFSSAQFFSKSTRVDEQGRRQIDFSQVAMGLLTGALAAGCAYVAGSAYAGVEGLRSPSR